MFLKIVFFIILIMIAVQFASSQVLFNLPKNDSTTSPVKELQNDIKVLLNNKDLSNTLLGISVVSLETGEIMFNRNENKNFIPASNLKLITTATALRYLGDDYRFQTRMYLDGKKTATGEFDGDIYIRGYGDPTISSSFIKNPFEIFDYFANVLDSLGISTINGNIIADDNFFDDKYYAPGWQIDDLLHSYAAEINGLSAFDNKLEISIIPGDIPGSETSLEISPDISELDIVNHVITTENSEEQGVFVLRELNSNLIDIYGNVGFDSTGVLKEKVSVTIDNPSLFFLNIFKSRLTQKFIELNGSLIDIDDSGFLPDYNSLGEYHSWYSPKLSEIIKVINKQSHNLASEMLLKTIARETLGFGSTQNGIIQVMKFLNKSGIITENIRIVDGSGLSRLNLISPGYFVSFLSNIYRSEYRDIYMLSLPSPGEDGTLKRRMTKSFAEKRVRAKTGAMNHISTISGYIKTRDDEPLAFSIMMSNFTAPITSIQNLQDLICMRLASFSRIMAKQQMKKEEK